MKKLYYLFILFLAMPIVVNASITDYYINATVEKNGDLNVEEYFILDGDYNGFERQIDYANGNAADFDPNAASFGGSTIHNGTGINIESVKGLNIDSNFNFENIPSSNFKEVDDANAGEYGKYTLNNNAYGISVKIFNPSKKHKAFYIKYTLKDMAILHNDVGELGWNILGDKLDEDIDYLHLYLNLPGNTNARVWGHGPLNGETKIISNDKLELKIDDLSMNTPIDIRAVFDKSVIPDSTKKTGVDALDKILTYENQMAEDANNKRRANIQNTIDSVNRDLPLCESNPTRECYEDVFKSISYIPNIDEYSEVKASYLSRLSKINETLNQMEESKAKEYVDIAKTKQDYASYMEACKYINILKDTNAKSKLTDELTPVLNNIKAREKEIDFKNMCKNILLGVIVIFVFGVLYMLFCRDGKDELKQKYYRDIPEEVGPWVLEYLMQHKITSKSISAGILYLINKGTLKYEKIEGFKKSDYKLTIIKSHDEDPNRTVAESELLKLIFVDEVKGMERTLSSLKNQAKDAYDDFLDRWDNFLTAAKNEAIDKEYYLEDENPLDIPNFISVLLFIVMICASLGLLFYQSKIGYTFLKELFALLKLNFISDLLMIACLAISIVIYIYLIRRIYKTIWSYSCSIRSFAKEVSNYIFVLLPVFIAYLNLDILKSNHFVFNSLYLSLGIMGLSLLLMFIFQRKYSRNKLGTLEYKKWIGFKNYLNDFSDFDNKELVEISIWEKYFVYAIILGCAKKLQKTMKIVLGKRYGDTEYLDYYNYMRLNDSLTHYVTRTHFNALNSKYESYTNKVVGTFSDGSGGGGGFSSGGGTFGGGGGGSRF